MNAPPEAANRTTAPRILVVDDDAGIRSLLCEMLRDAGYEHGEAGDGPSALEAVRAAKWDVVVTDHHMPGMTGTALVRTLRGAGNRIPVVLLTGYAYDISREDARDLGITAVVQKPCPIKQILDAVSAALNGQSALDERG